MGEDRPGRLRNEGTAVRLRQDRARSSWPAASPISAGSSSRAAGPRRRWPTPASPTSRWPTSPAPRRCSAAGSRPSTRPSTAASWPTGPIPTTWLTSSARGIGLIDLVVCNLYPSRRALGRADRHRRARPWSGPRPRTTTHVGVVVDPGRVRGGAGRAAERRLALDRDTRRALARAAFAHTAAYDAAIVDWFDGDGPPDCPMPGALPELLPPTIQLTLERAGSASATARTPTSTAPATASPGRGRGGTTSSSTAARSSPTSTSSTPTPPGGWCTSCAIRAAIERAVAIIKHANPCGAAVDADLADRLPAGPRVRPTSAFGGIVAIGGAGDRDGGRGHRRRAPGRRDHRPLLRRRRHSTGWWPSARPPACCRRRRPSPWSASSGGSGPACWSRTPTGSWSSRSEWEVVTKAAPDRGAVARPDHGLEGVRPHHVQRRRLVVNGGQAVGVGAGQQSRVVAAEIAVAKAGRRAKGWRRRQRRLLPVPRRPDGAGRRRGRRRGPARWLDS